MKTNLLSIVCLLILASSVNAQPHTLIEALQARGLRDVTGIPQELLQSTMSSGVFMENDAVVGRGIHEDERGIVFVRSESRQQNELQLQLLVPSAGSTLRYKQLQVNSQLFGAVDRVQRSDDFLYLHSKLSPSAAATLVLRMDDFAVHDELRGWVLNFLPDQSVLMHDNLIHFASTHPASVTRYDPHQHSSMRIYPPLNPDPVRLAFTETVRSAYANKGSEWFSGRNMSDDPTRFSVSIGQIAVDPASSTAAFRVIYSALPGAIDEGISTAAFVICRHSADGSYGCREYYHQQWLDALGVKPEDIAAPNPQAVMPEPYLQRVLLPALADPDLVPCC